MILNVEDVNITSCQIKATMYPESNNEAVKKEIEAYLNAEKAQSFVKTIPQHVQRALEQRDALEKINIEKIKEFTVYESGISLGIIVGNSTKAEVFNIMKNYSKISFIIDDATPIHFYSDISLYVFFDEYNIVEELKFVNNYIGMTSKGLMLGDTIEEAITIYGQPKMRSTKGAVWNQFAVFCDHDIINSIRIHK